MAWEFKVSERVTTHEHNGEQNISLSEAREHHERLNKHHEHAAESHKSTKHEAEQAREQVEQHAISGAESHRPHSEQRQHHHVVNKEAKTLSFDTTMHHVRQSMSKPERVFSKLIHRPGVEKTSEVVGKTIARPSGIIGATIAAFVGILLLYGVAKFVGFELSGSEVPLLLLIGFALGLLGEWVFKAVRSIFFSKS